MLNTPDLLVSPLHGSCHVIIDDDIMFVIRITLSVFHDSDLEAIASVETSDFEL